MTFRPASIVALTLGVAMIVGTGSLVRPNASAQSARAKFVVIPGTPSAAARRFTIRQDGIVVGTLEVPPTVRLTFQPTEASLQGVQGSTTAGYELADNSDLLLEGRPVTRLERPATTSPTVRIQGASVTLERQNYALPAR